MFPSVWNKTLNKNTQETPHKEIDTIRVKVKDSIPLKTNAYLREKITSKQKIPALTKRLNSKPPPISMYEEDEYKPSRVDA